MGYLSTADLAMLLHGAREVFQSWAYACCNYASAVLGDAQARQSYPFTSFTGLTQGKVSHATSAWRACGSRHGQSSRVACLFIIWSSTLFCSVIIQCCPLNPSSSLIDHCLSFPDRSSRQNGSNRCEGMRGSLLNIDYRVMAAPTWSL